MYKLVVILFFIFISCHYSTKMNDKELTNKNKIEKNYNKIDTIWISQKDTIFDGITEKDMLNFNDDLKIKPTKRITLGEIDSVSEGFVFKNDSIVIYQPINDVEIFEKDTIRKVYINGKLLTIKRVIFKDINESKEFYPHYFNHILMDYYYFNRLYYIKSRYVWIDQPMVWCGKNHWRFALVINPKNNEVKEVFINFDN